jgi:muramoyltetrapeptide carboxypeptidase
VPLQKNKFKSPCLSEGIFFDMQFKEPPYLKKGDKIAFVSTARKVTLKEIEFAINFFKSNGLEVITAPNLFQEHHQFSGTDSQRIEDLNWAINNNEIKAIICVRGGYGTTRILDNIDFSSLHKSPKWVAGFSDVTALHFKLNSLGIQSIHSTMPILFHQENAKLSNESLLNTLMGENINIECKNHFLNRKGQSKGIIIGGNLSLIHNMIGTNSDINFEGKILFIEDIDEYLYHIDRMMGHLKRANKLKNLAGLIVGHFTDMKDNQVPFGMDAYRIISESVAEYNYPVCFGFPTGHDFDNLALKCGAEVQLEVNSNTILSF